jgi:hypothetical protein
LMVEAGPTNSLRQSSMPRRRVGSPAEVLAAGHTRPDRCKLAKI